MNALLASVLLVAAALPAGAASPKDGVNWMEARVTSEQREALASQGLRFEDDGVVLDSRTGDPVTAERLAAALAGLDAASRRAALERLSVLLAKTPPDLEAARALRDGLPPEVAKALDAGLTVAALRRLTETGLEKLGPAFDGSRTGGGGPVSAGTSSPRVPYPYFNDAERRLGDSLRGAAVSWLSKDAVGGDLLGHFKGRDGKPDLPPILVEELPGNDAKYDYARRALVVDRAMLLASVAGDAAPADRAAITTRLATRDALIAYCAAHPEVVASFVAKKDVLLFHELVHAEEDRRDPVMREMARGALPRALLIDYEVEANTRKNLYLHSRLKSGRSPELIEQAELDDYRAMTRDRNAWERAITHRYDSWAINAMTMIDARAVTAARLRRAPSSTPSPDRAEISRAERDLARVSRELNANLSSLEKIVVRQTIPEAPKLLAEHYLALAARAKSGPDFDSLLRRAGDYARQAGDAALSAKIRAAQGSHP